MNRGISIITLGVRNVEKSVKFYEALGWKLSPDSDPGMCTFIKTPNGVIGLVGYEFLANDIGIECSERKIFNGFTLAINGATPEEVDEIFDIAIKAGARPHEMPKWKDWGGFPGYSGYFEDIDGYYWEIAHAPFCGLSDEGTLLPK